MGHRGYGIAIALAFSLSASICGCAAKKGAPAREAAARTEAVVYSAYDEPDRLTVAERGEIDSVIAEAGAKAGKVWFIYVRYHRDGIYRVSVYFQPVVAGDSRVRHGEAISLDNTIPIERRREVLRRVGAAFPVVYPYVQVSESGDRAGATPAESALPFAAPEALRYEELVRVVDVARAAAVQKDAAAAKMPISGIDCATDGHVSVVFGWLAGPLDGQGIFVELRRKGADFEMESVGNWVS